jgi:hypothetical protein
MVFISISAIKAMPWIIWLFWYKICSWISTSLDFIRDIFRVQAVASYQTNKEAAKMNESYKRIFLYCLLIILTLVIFYVTPRDDGLRHVGLAFGNFESWGEVYPFSIFEEFKDYNPWFGYDLILRIIAGALKHLPISLLTLKFFLLKFLSFLFSLIFFFLVLKKSKILNEIKDRNTFTLAIILVVAVLSFPFSRVLLARPFAFGTFFIIYSVGQEGFVRGFLASLILSFFYPYLCWFYILPVAFAHYIRGDKKFAIGAIFLLIIFLLIQPASFWGFQIALFKSDIVRSALNSKIGEFGSISKFFLFYLYLATFIIFFPKFSQNVRRLNYQNILLLFYLFPSFKYNRYFWDIVLPLIFISFGKELLHILLAPYQDVVFSWKITFQEWHKKIVTTINWRRQKFSNKSTSTNSKSGKSLKPLIIIIYLFICFLLILINYKQLDSNEKFREGLLPIHEKSLVLTSFNLQYKTLFSRPDLRLIPSCEIGFTRDVISKEYISFLNDGILSKIFQKTGAEYYLDNKNTYIDPKESRFLTLLSETNSFKIWKVSDPAKKKGD